MQCICVLHMPSYCGMLKLPYEDQTAALLKK